ncbi:MAG TPA: NYN domain-containing protein, partial [Streptosporangiaceae bacterium]
MDRCALFVDAGYVLADGAMAVHGTRHRESVSWNYAGLLQFLGSVASDRTGLPLLRCYWYEATVEGRRSAEHDALADLPGVKLRLGRMRPGRREGVESEIHRDLTTLARNGALQDALVVSAEEDLAQVIADVQDLGLRVTLVHITVDGNWTISRALRQECDDIVEIGEAHLRPYVELVVGAEPLRDDERHGVGAYPGRALTNGHGPVGPLGHQQALPAGSNPAPPEIYTAPVIAEYQRTAQPGMNGQPGAQQPANPSGPIGVAPSEQQAPQPGRSQNAPPAPAADVQPGAGVMPGMQQPAGMAAQPAAPVGQPAPAQGQAAQTSGPMPAQPGMPPPAAAAGMAGQPGSQQPPAGQLPAPRQRRGRNAAASQGPAAVPPAAHAGQQPAAPAPTGQQAAPVQQVAPGQQAVPGQQPVPGQPMAPVQQAMPGQPMAGPPGMQAPPVQPGQPGMAPPQGGPLGAQVPPAAQIPQAPPGVQAEQPIYPAPP